MSKVKKTNKEFTSQMHQAKKKARKPSKTSADEAKKPANLNEEIRFTHSAVKKGLRNVASHHIESFDYSI